MLFAAVSAAMLDDEERAQKLRHRPGAQESGGQDNSGFFRKGMGNVHCEMAAIQSPKIPDS
jgi:hypothetical protein